MTRRVFACLALVFFLGATVPTAKAQVDPRLKALGLMAAYGAVGGFLLGTATLAFDSPGRSPFIGASLGLYAGILFGTYVVASHAIKKQRDNAPDEEYYPETPDTPYSFGGGGDEEEEGDEGVEERWRPLHQPKAAIPTGIDSRRRLRPNVGFYLPLLSIQF